jgi:hypothetical protein
MCLAVSVGFWLPSWKPAAALLLIRTGQAECNLGGALRARLATRRTLQGDLPGGIGW